MSATRFPFPANNTYLLIRKGEFVFRRLNLLSDSELDQFQTDARSGSGLIKARQHWRAQQIDWALCMQPVGNDEARAVCHERVHRLLAALEVCRWGQRL